MANVARTSAPREFQVYPKISGKGNRKRMAMTCENAAMPVKMIG